MNKVARKRILHVIISLNSGGAEHMLCKVVENTDRDLYDVYVLSLTGKGFYSERLEKCGVQVISLELGKGFVFLKKLFTFLKGICYEPYDVYQGWMYHANFFTLILGVLSPKSKVFWNIRQSINNWDNEKFHAKLFIRLCSVFSFYPIAIVNNSKASIEQHTNIGFKEGKQFYIPNGFDADFFDSDPGKSNDSEITKFCTVARYHPNKGHIYLLRAFAKLKNQIDSILILVGSGCDENNLSLIEMLDDLDIRDKVFLLGEREDINCILKDIDIFVLPSIGVEGFPNALGEAMLSRKVCIATDVGDSRFIVNNYGFIVKEKSVYDLYSNMRIASNLSFEQKTKIGDEARNHILHNYSIENVAKQYERMWLNFE